MGERPGRPRRRIWPYLFIAPVQLSQILIILLPVLFTLWLSFQAYTYGRPASFVGPANYLELFRDRAFLRALLNNILFVNVVVYGELLIGLGLAVFFAGGVPLRRLMVSIVMAPYAVSPVLGVLMWRFVVEPDIGLLNGLLRSAGLPQLLWTVIPAHAFIVIVVLAVWLQVPFTFLILYSSILGIPGELFEAARVDGAGGWQVFRHVTLPVIMPAVLISLTFRYIFAFRTFDVVWVLTQGGPYRSTELLSIYLYRMAFRYFDFGAAAAVSWIMVLVTLLIAAWYFRVMYRRMFRGEA